MWFSYAETEEEEEAEKLGFFFSFSVFIFFMQKRGHRRIMPVDPRLL